jgi:hypothetical protein
MTWTDVAKEIRSLYAKHQLMSVMLTHEDPTTGQDAMGTLFADDSALRAPVAALASRSDLDNYA